MSWQDSLLTAEAAPWEKALEKTSAARWPLAWELLRTLHSPDDIPVDKLPILAWALSVDLWDERWPIEKKRSVVRRAIADHSIKGTVAGVRRYLEIEDSNLVQLLAPPQRTFASRTLTKAEYDEWLRQMPQLRVYLQSKPGDGTGLDFAGDGFAAGAAFDQESEAHAFGRFDAGAAIYGRFPYLYRPDGSLTPLKTAELISSTGTRNVVDTEQYMVPGIGGLSFVGSAYAGEAHADDEVLAPQAFTVRLEREYLHDTSTLSLTTASPGYRPINVRFERESEIGNGGPYVFAGDFASSSFFVGFDEARWMIYDRIYLLDPTIAAPLVDALSFANHTRVGMDPFTFEALVDAEDVAEPGAGFDGNFVGEVFARPEVLDKIDRALDAVALAKGYRDKALVTFETTRSREWGDGLPMDSSVPVWSRVPATL